MESMICELYDLEAIKFGSFLLKSGITSPVYVDFRSLLRKPRLTKVLAERIFYEINKQQLQFDSICGVPYGALVFASAISHRYEIPMLIFRKEAKTHGTKNLVEGLVPGERCIVVEDVVTSGSSIIETVKGLRKEGLIVEHALCLLDREQGGSDNLRSENIRLSSVMKLSDVYWTLRDLKKLSCDVDKLFVEHFPNVLNESSHRSKAARRSWIDRINVLQHPTSKALAEIINRKQTNLCVAADLLSGADIIQLAREIGSQICMLKLHSVAVQDFSACFVKELLSVAQTMDFLVLEDRKFADIGNTVEREVRCEPFSICDWANAVTVHSVSGSGVLDGIEKGYSQSAFDSCAFLILEMSAKGSLTSIPEYAEQTMSMACSHRNVVGGFICQKGHCDDSFLYLSPGVNLGKSGDQLGQQFRSPEKAIIHDLVDIVIVGRGITEDPNRASAAQEYRNAAWKAYEQSLN